MDLDFWVKVFDRLLPRSRAWNLIFNRILRKFFHGLAILPQMIWEYICAVLLEVFPTNTTRNQDWSVQFGSPELMTNEEIESAWGAMGGQSPKYIQDTLQAAGFDVYVHEWWVPGSNPVIYRNPIALVDTSRVLVNDLTSVQKNYTYQFGDGTEFIGNNSVSFGVYDGYFLHPKQYPTPDIPEEYPFYFYVCAETWPDYAIVDEDRLRALIRLIYKLKPVHLRCILRVTAVSQDDIQDTIDSTDEWQDIILGPDDVQDQI